MSAVNRQALITFTEQCLQSTAEEALIIAGRQGGLIRLQGRTFSEAQPWVGDTFVSGTQRVPYWYHTMACNNPNGCVVFAPPPLCELGECYIDGQYEGAGTSIQEEVEFFIEENLDTCLNDFQSLESTMDVRSGDPRVQVSFREDDVDIQLVLDITAQDVQTQEVTRLDQFSTRLDVDFEELYRLARDILSLQYTTTFAEENFLHFLSLYQGDPPGLPPFNDVSFFGGSKMWMRADAQRTIEQEVLPYLSFLQIVNAREGYAPIIDTGVDSDDELSVYARGLFSYAELLLADRDYPDLAVSFLYPYSPIYLNINDREVLKGDDLSGDNFLMKIVGVLIKKYEHKYDVAFPLLVTIEDDDALLGRGFVFTFGLEANIVNNFPYYAGRSITTIDQRTFGTLDQHEPQHLLDNQVTVIVRDAYDQTLVDKATIVYECGWRFELGQTNTQGEWTGQLPFCLGGALRAEKATEYYPVAAPFDSQSPGEFSVALNMWRYAEKEIVVYKRTTEHVERFENIATQGCLPLSSCREELTWGGMQTYNISTHEGETVADMAEECTTCITQTLTVSDDQYALVMINRIPEGLVSDQSPLVSALTFGDDDADPVLDAQIDLDLIQEFYDSGQLTDEEFAFLSQQTLQEAQWAINLSRRQTIDLIPGTYTLDAMLFYTGGLYIPSEKRGGGLFSPSVRLPEQEFPTWLQGGVQFDETNPVTFTPEEIYGPNPLVIYVLEQELPRTWSELENNYELIHEYQEGRDVLAQPRFEP